MTMITSVLHDKNVDPIESTNPLPIAEPYATLNSGAKTVTSAGTAEALVGASTPGRLVAITANSTNTGRVAVGASNVVASTDGFSLGAGETAILPVPGDDLANLYIDATVSTEGVKFTVFN